jgi:hypothetical protein
MKKRQSVYLKAEEVNKFGKSHDNFKSQKE